MSDPVKVSIIIPVKPGGVVSALTGLRMVDYPSDLLEILVAEGRSPSRQRNLAAAAATGEILYFLDDDSQVSPGFVRRAVHHYADPAVAAVGGPSLTPDADTPLQHAFGLAFASLVGGGGMRNRYRRTGGVRKTCDRELILCNLSFRRETFRREVGFDERLYPNEENELMERISRGGGKLIHDPDLAVHRSQRPTLRAFCRQLYGYGRGRGEQTILSGVVKPITFVPAAFLLYLLLLPFIRERVYYLPFLGYLAATFVVALCAAARTKRIRSACMLPVVLPLFHICYGAGLVRGLLTAGKGKPGSQGDEVTIRRMKEFGGPLQP